MTRPRSLADPREIERRRAMLNEPHMAPLTRWVAQLRERNPAVEIPNFDPEGGGINADILFLAEKPGPKTSRQGGGSGFISTSNNDPTAEASWHFMAAAGIDVARTCHWNTIPWWNGTIAIEPLEVERGLRELPPLLKLLPRLRVVVLVGRKAERAEPVLRQAAPGLAIIKSAHPSPRVRASYRHSWDAIPVRWAEARAIADLSDPRAVSDVAESIGDSQGG